MEWRLLLLEGFAGNLSFANHLVSECGASVLRCRDAREAISYHVGPSSPCILLGADADLQKLLAGSEGVFDQMTNLLRVLVVARKIEPPSLLLYLLRGCAGVIEQGVPGDLFCCAIKAILRGELWFPRRVLADALHDLLGGPALTAREAEILQLVSQGRKNQEIATRLFISRETVRWHLRTVYGKLGIHNRLGAAELAGRLTHLLLLPLLLLLPDIST